MAGGRRHRPAGAGDRDLVAAAQAGDERALNDLLERHYERVYVLCRRIAGPDDALDATQEALIAIVRGLPRYDGRAAFTTWAYRVTTNACLDELRRRKRRATPMPIDDTVEPAAPDAPGLDETAADRLRIDAALDTLSPDFRAAVVLRDVLGLDYREIAAVLGVPPGTVRSRIARGRRALASELEGNPARVDSVEEGTS